MRRTRVGVFIHLIWATWDRLPLLHGEIQERAYRAIGAKCEELGARLIAPGGVEDHVHLLVLLPSTLTIADLIGQVKGASSHLIAQEVLAPTGGFFKWQGAYAAFSVSPHQLREITNYIYTSASIITQAQAHSKPNGNIHLMRRPAPGNVSSHQWTALYF